MKRIITMFTLVTLTIVGLFLGNQALLFAKPSVTAAETMWTANQLYESGQYAQASAGLPGPDCVHSNSRNRMPNGVGERFGPTTSGARSQAMNRVDQYTENS